MCAFTLEKLDLSAARLAYPLVQAAESRVQLRAWMGFVRRAQGKLRGVIIATRIGRKFPCGMFAYQCIQDPALGRVMMVDYFIALDILDAGPLTQAMVTEIDALAQQFDCQAVRAMLRHPHEEVAQCLISHGHTLDSKEMGAG